MSADRSPFALQPVFQALTADDPREIDGHRLYARLGAGGMGRVYLAHTPGGRPVALKVVRPELAGDPDFRARFAQEVASARLIHGLFTAQLVDAGPDAPTPWLATTYVPGPSLQQVVQRFGPLPERTVLLLMAGIAEALQAIHASGVVHRDLKPANVLIAADGPRVIDFGIARAADAVALTGTGLQIGSPAYMAPEQATGQAATTATDVWALGALAVHIAGGAPPFGDGPHPATLYRTVHEEPALDHVPEALRDLLRRCLAKHPGDRPTTTEVIAAAAGHPAVGGQLRFGEDWLPQPLTSQITRHADLPQVPAEASGPGLDSAPTMPAPAAVPTPTRLASVPGAPAVAAATSVPAATPVRATAAQAAQAAPAGRLRRTRGRTPLIAVAALAVGAVATAFVLDDSDPVEAATADAPVAGSPAPGAPVVTPTPAGPSGPARPPSATAGPGRTTPPPPTAAFAPDYRAVELTSADPGYEFDLATGTVVPVDTVNWYVGRTDSEFLVPETADSYIGRDSGLGLAECLQGLGSRPTARLPFSALGARGAFCVRSADGKELALVRVLSTAGSDGPVSVSLDHYRRND
ncbi:serine/threonine-protein kinase [Kitasatospora sp. NPDC015120]|uniref:serine/threonine-protein kinase n=1 Tax=Kitasatospora sp. NPDC015120 TaxID=3364023 RepID=UPI0036F47904